MFLTTNMSCQVGEQKSTMTTLCQGGRETGLYSLMLSALGHHLSLADILPGPHHRGSNRNALAVHGLQFYEDGRRIALYANTLPGSFLLKEVVG